MSNTENDSAEHGAHAPRVTCDECDTPVCTTGYLGGGIVCSDCAKEGRGNTNE